MLMFFLSTLNTWATVMTLSPCFRFPSPHLQRAVSCAQLTPPRASPKRPALQPACYGPSFAEGFRLEKSWCKADQRTSGSLLHAFVVWLAEISSILSLWVWDQIFEYIQFLPCLRHSNILNIFRSLTSTATWTQSSETREKCKRQIYRWVDVYMYIYIYIVYVKYVKWKNMYSIGIPLASWHQSSSL